MTIDAFKKLTSVSFALWLCALPSNGAGAITDETVSVKVTEENGMHTMWLKPTRVREVLIDVTGELSNMTSTVTLPCTIELDSHRQDLTIPVKLVSVKPTGHGPYTFNWHYYKQIGLTGGNPDPNYVYNLPFQRGQLHYVAQGYGGKFSHKVGSDDEYSQDFDMPIGTTVCAARGGEVIAVRTDSNAGGPDLAKYNEAANYIIIRHSDRTYGAYVHLDYNGALVTAGQNVVAGQPIARSGNTGMTTSPHLHFQVYVAVSGQKKKSVPVKFRTANGTGLLREGASYRAL